MEESNLRRTCRQCSQSNKVEPEELVTGSRCGRCRYVLTPLKESFPVDRHTLAEVLSGVKAPVCVEFFETANALSAQMKAETERLAEEIRGRGLVLRFDLAADRRSALNRYGVETAPTLLIYRREELLYAHRQPESWKLMLEWVKLAWKVERLPRDEVA